MMQNLADLLSDMDDLCVRITAQTLEQWDENYRDERSRALSLGTVRRGDIFTANEMFGYHRDGRLVKNGWKQILGLDLPDIEIISTNVEQHELTPGEQGRQAKANSGNKRETQTIKRVIRFQISNSVFEN